MSTDIRDFTPEKSDISFSLYGKTFTAHADIPVNDLALVFELQDKVNESNSVEDLHNMFRILLQESCAEEFIALFGSKETPLGIKTVAKILHWLFEELELDPTVLSESSSPGQANPESGMSSTVNVSGEVLSLPSS